MFDKLIELLAALPVNAVLRIEVERLIKRVAELEKEIADLSAVVDEQQRQLAAEATRKEQPVKFRGVCWERDSSGRYAADPICPKCHVALWGTEDFIFLECSSCHFRTPFPKGELSAIYAEMLSIYGDK